MPEALGGRIVLYESSCERCRRELNEGVDGPVLSIIFETERAQFKVPARRPPKTRATSVLKVVEQLSPNSFRTDPKPFRIPMENHPPLIVLHRLDPPRILTGRKKPNRYKTRGMKIHFGANFLERLRWQEARGFVTAKQESMTPFGRMLAKVAHAFAYYEEVAFEPLLLDIIHGRDDDVMLYFGGGTDEIISEPGAEYGLRLREQNGFLVVDVQVFANLKMPVYQVVVGRPLSSEDAEQETAPD